MALTVGSLFAGIGGFDLGFERSGFQIKWQVEIDPFCRAVLAKHWPDVRRYEDVRSVHHRGACKFKPEFDGPCDDHLEDVDVLVGGFPCQDISVAGLNAGIDGERSGLWREYGRLIGELRPRYVVVENVSALLARGLERVLGDLAESGYDAEWDCIPASAVGAPHRRDRVWIVAYPASADARGRSGQREGAESAHGESPFILSNPSGRSGAAASGRDYRTQMADSLKQQRHGWSDGVGWWDREPLETLQDARLRGRQEDGLPVPESLLGRVADGVPARVDRLRGLGNAIVPQIAEWIARRIAQADNAVAGKG